eukprot:2085297-Rhodomonas_salina.2
MLARADAQRAQAPTQGQRRRTGRTRCSAAGFRRTAAGSGAGSGSRRPNGRRWSTCKAGRRPTSRLPSKVRAPAVCAWRATCGVEDGAGCGPRLCASEGGLSRWCVRG